MHLPPYSPHVSHWLLDRQMVFLNHGSFGACPSAVLAVQSKYRRQMETQPIRFMMREYESMFKNAKSVLADFVGAHDKDLVYVRNATEGVNTVLNSIRWTNSDRVLITDHIYPACRNAVFYYAAKYGFRVDEVQLPYPLTHSDEALMAVIEGIQTDTRLLIIDHVASPTAMVFPVRQLADTLKHTDIEILVDGAHAPGALSLNINELGVHYYTGNCHKWMCSPKGAAFLWVAPHAQKTMMPLNVSLINTTDVGFQGRFYWTGTADPSAFLCVPDVIQCLETIAGSNFQSIIHSNHQLAIEASHILSNALDMPLPCPEEMMASMVAFLLPERHTSQNPNSFDPLQQQLYHEFKIEVPVTLIPTSGKRYLRISCHLYNSIAQYEYLAEALSKILKNK